MYTCTYMNTYIYDKIGLIWEEELFFKYTYVTHHSAILKKHYKSLKYIFRLEK